ncbi:MAG: hypothetical protein ACLPXT_02420 [Terracidiphilus sp.]
MTVLAVLFTLTRFLSLSGKRDKAENALALWIGIGVLSPPVLALAHILWITECYDEKSQASHIFVMLLVTILLNRLGVFCEFEWDGRRTWDARSSPFNRYFQVSRATHIQSVESETEVQSEITYEQWLNEERKNLKSPPESERPNTRS